MNAARENWVHCPACPEVTWQGTGPERARQGWAHVNSAEHEARIRTTEGRENIRAYWANIDAEDAAIANAAAGMLW